MSRSLPLPSAHPDRRRSFRVPITVGIRVRPRPSGEDWSGDLVNQYELLGRSAQRFRKEATPGGRQFVDQLMHVLDRLTAAATEQGGAGGWSPRLVVEATLSAGGIGYIGTARHPEGSLLGVEFALPEEISAVPFRCDALVVRCDPRPAGRWDVGLEFEDLGSVTQERLIRILFEVQRKRLRDRRSEV